MAKTPPVVTEQEKQEAAQKTLAKLKEELLNTEISYGKSLLVLQEFFQKKLVEIQSAVANDERVALFEKAIKSALDANKKTQEMLVKLNSENLSPAEYIKRSGELIAAEVIPQLSNGLLAYAGLRDLAPEKKEKLEKLSRDKDLDEFAKSLDTSNGGFSSNLITITQRGPRYDMLYAEMNKQNNIIIGEPDKSKDNILSNIKAANKKNNQDVGDYVEKLAKAAKDNATELRGNFIDNKGKPKNGGEPKIYINQIPKKFKLDAVNLDLLKQNLGPNFNVHKRSGGLFGNDKFIVTDDFGQSIMQITLKTKLFGESSITIKPLIDPKSQSNAMDTKGLIGAMVKSASVMEGTISEIRKVDRGGTLDVKSRDKTFVQSILNVMVKTEYLTEELSTKSKNEFAKELTESYKTLEKPGNMNAEVPQRRTTTSAPSVSEGTAQPPLLSEFMRKVHHTAEAEERKQPIEPENQNAKIVVKTEPDIKEGSKKPKP